jgi:hypothetical protein
MTVAATGGTETTVGGYRIHTFTGDGSLVVSAGGDIEVLVVAGAGGGGGAQANARAAGGGGGGGIIYDPAFAVTPQTYAITVGPGGAGGVGLNNGAKGTNSTFSDFAAPALGGGGGAKGQVGATNNGQTGGSGGGGTCNAGTGGATEDVGQGHDGGAGGPASGNYTAGGGGGADAVGVAGQSTVGGNGGAGLDYSAIFGALGGDAGRFGGGGGGGTYNGGTAGIGGIGGGGAGKNTAANGVDGTANTGGGGGGAGTTGAAGGNGGAGGSGIVIVRYNLNVPLVAITADPFTLSTTQAGDFAAINATLKPSWMSFKDSGPWAFTPQPAKYGYRNNPRWMDLLNIVPESTTPVWPTEQKLMSAGSSKNHAPCGYWFGGPGGGTIIGGGGGAGVPCVSIGYTSQLMYTGSAQIFVCLDADGSPIPNHGCTWSVTGGGSITQQGVYTAPADNSDCTNTPVIVLTCGSKVIDSVALAITTPVPQYAMAYIEYSNLYVQPCTHDTNPGFPTCGNGELCAIENCTLTRIYYDCADEVYATPADLVTQVNFGIYPGCFPEDTCPDFGSPSFNDLLASSPVDMRSAYMIAAGCCPTGLL